MWVEENKRWGLGSFNTKLNEHVHGNFEIRREKELIQKLEEENRRRMVRSAHHEIAEKDKRRTGRYRVFLRAVRQWHWAINSCFDEVLELSQLLADAASQTLGLRRGTLTVLAQFAQSVRQRS